MPLTLKGYEARCHLCDVRPLGPAHSLSFIYRCRLGTRPSSHWHPRPHCCHCPAIWHHANRAWEFYRLSLWKAIAKVIHLSCFSKSKSEFNHKFNNYYPIFLYRRPLRGIDRPIGRGRYRAGVLCAPRLLRPPFARLVFHAPHWLRCERLCVFAEERAPARSGTRDRIVATEVQRARIGPNVGIAQQ